MSVLEREQRNTNRRNHVNGRASAENNGGGDDSQKYFQSVENILEYILTSEAPIRAGGMVDNLITRLREAGLNIPPVVSTPYINTIPVENQPEYPGDLEVERRIKS